MVKSPKPIESPVKSPAKEQFLPVMLQNKHVINANDNRNTVDNHNNQVSRNEEEQTLQDQDHDFIG